MFLTGVESIQPYSIEDGRLRSLFLQVVSAGFFLPTVPSLLLQLPLWLVPFILCDYFQWSDAGVEISSQQKENSGEAFPLRVF